MPFGKLLKACGKIALVTLSTTSSAATLPTTINVEGDVVANLMIAKSMGEYDGAAQKSSETA